MGRAARLPLAAALVLLAAVAVPADEASDAEPRLRADVEDLASPERRGRGAWEDRVAAAAFIAERFRAAGLVPPPSKPSMLLDSVGEREPRTRNVAAWLPGRSSEEYVLVGAHYDHLGVRQEQIHFGADDNASGVAAVLEAARVLGARAPERRPARGVLLVAFDLEEEGLTGSRRFAEDPPLPLDRCAAMICVDMMGRSVADAVPGLLLVHGSEHSEALEAAVDGLGPPKGGRLGVLGADFNPGQSDYVPFQERRVPFLFLTTGAHEDWHRPTDVPGRIDFAGLARRAAWLTLLMERIADLGSRPAWRDDRPTVRLDEIRAVADVVAGVEARLPEMETPALLVQAIGNFSKHLQRILEAGTATREQRDAVRNTARMLLRQASLVRR